MKVITIPHKLWTKGKSFIQTCSYYWNKVVRHITIDSPPVFIVGCGHSGTSILLAILGSHSRIYAVPYESRIAKHDNPQLFQEALKRFDKLAVLAGKHRWIEKTPRHICHIGRILKWRPESRILLIIRDGRDVAYSIQARNDKLEAGTRRWVNDNLAGKEYWHNPNVYVVKYEDLIGNFELTVGGILSFLNEKYEGGMKDYHKIPRKWYSNEISKPSTATQKNHKQYRNWQINQPLFDNRGRWKKLSADELTIVNDIAGELLIELGYTGVDNSTTDQIN
jgi:hypothetical protein